MREYSYYLAHHSKVAHDGSVSIDTVVECIPNLGSNGPPCYDEDRYYVSLDGVDFGGKNVEMHLPRFVASVSGIVTVTKPVSLFLDIGLSEDHGTFLWKALFGATGGYEFPAVAVSGGLFAGVQNQTISYAVLSGNSIDGFRELSATSTSPAIFLRGHIGVNSVKELLFINPFLNVGYSYSDLLTISGGSEGYDEYHFSNNLYFWTLKAGIFKDIGRTRLVAGFALHLLDDIVLSSDKMMRRESYYLNSYPFLSLSVGIGQGKGRPDE